MLESLTHKIAVVSRGKGCVDEIDQVVLEYFGDFDDFDSDEKIFDVGDCTFDGKS